MRSSSENSSIEISLVVFMMSPFCNPSISYVTQGVKYYLGELSDSYSSISSFNLREKDISGSTANLICSSDRPLILILSLRLSM